MYKVEYLPKAVEELKGGIKWYEGERMGLGRRFEKAVEAKIELISQFPKRYPKRRHGFQETPLKVFPYLILYEFYEDRKLNVSSMS